MAKFYGKIGFGVTEELENEPGIFTTHTSITEKSYRGDVTKLGRRLETGNEANDSFKVTNRISIVANPFAYANIYNIKYVVYLGVKWEVTSMSIEQPRIVLTLGGVYSA